MFQDEPQVMEHLSGILYGFSRHVDAIMGCMNLSRSPLEAYV